LFISGLLFSGKEIQRQEKLNNCGGKDYEGRRRRAILHCQTRVPDCLQAGPPEHCEDARHLLQLAAQTFVSGDGPDGRTESATLS